jgi:predicted esterase
VKSKILILIFSVMLLVNPSPAQTPRYQDQVFSEVTVHRNIEYATAPALNNPIALLADYNIHEGESITQNRPLLMDIFIPKNDTLKKRPAIIFLHGGAFILGSRNNEDMVAMCDSFARRGYVTATIDYRLGMGAVINRIFGIPVGIQISKTNARRALYRATQDSRAAIRFLKHHAENYGIDTSKIFMAGSSAGAIATLNNFYLGENEIPPEAAQNPGLGSIDATGISGYNGTADAAISFWGALENLEIIENKNAPLFLVHGTEDDIVPFKKGIPLEGIVPPNQLVTLDMPETYGSYCIDTFLTGRDIFPETWFAENQKHEFYGVNTGEFTEDGPNHYWDTTIQKTSNFLFDLIKPNAQFEYEIDNRNITVFNQSETGLSTKWEFGEYFTSDEWESGFTFPEYGKYKVKLTVCNSVMACDTTSQTVNIIPTNTTHTAYHEIKVYPNPVSNHLKIIAFTNSFSISVYNSTGHIILNKNAVTESYVDVSQLKNGIYTLKINSGNISLIKKIVKVD